MSPLKPIIQKRVKWEVDDVIIIARGNCYLEEGLWIEEVWLMSLYLQADMGHHNYM